MILLYFCLVWLDALSPASNCSNLPGDLTFFIFSGEFSAAVACTPVPCTAPVPTKGALLLESLLGIFSTGNA